MNIKQYLKTYRRLYPLYLLKGLITFDAFCDSCGIRRKPRVLQMPITSRCNSRCVTCNIWKLTDKKDIDPNELRLIISDPFFSRVNAVGINGGEITLVPNFIDILEAILSIKRLRAIFIITNGLLPNKLLPLLRHTKVLCHERGVNMYVTLSVDGVGKVHESVRGVPNCFERTKLLLNEFKSNPDQYADHIMVGCTLSQKNIAYVQETEAFLNQYPFSVQYHLAVPNKRIHTFDSSDDYYILNDEHSRMLALEYFYGKFYSAGWSGKFAYFCQYFFLLNKGKGRLSRCNFKYRDVTISEEHKLYLCATASETLGSLSRDSIKDTLNKNNFKYAEMQVALECDRCIHYVGETPTIKGLLIFIKELIRQHIDWHKKFGKRI